MQEIQEALDERQNNLDSLPTDNRPFAFESQIDTDTYPINLSLKSTDDSLQQGHNGLETNTSNETVPLLAAPMEKNHSRNSSWTSTKNVSNIKKEAITPVKLISIFSFSKTFF